MQNSYQFSSCFADLQDELVISRSDDGDLLVWSLPNDQQQGICVNEPLKTIITNHQDFIQHNMTATTYMLNLYYIKSFSSEVTRLARK